MDRSAGYLIHAMGQTKVAANLSLLMPGSSFIYYGEEIGMLGSRGGNNTDANRRLAMLWGDEDTVKNPVGANYAAKQANGTVKEHLTDPNSLYNHYKKLIAVRKANPEIANGTYTSLSLNEGKVGGFLSQYEGKTVAVIHNTTTTEVTIDLSKYPQIPSTQLAAFVGVGTASLNGTTLTLAGQTSVVLR
jgi:glycosidase